MRVSAKSDYALRALIEIAGDAEGTPISAEAVGRRQEIPHGFLLAILADLRRAGIVAIVTHELAFARDVADEVVFMDDGVVVERGAPDVVLASPRQERTRQFIRRLRPSL